MNKKILISSLLILTVILLIVIISILFLYKNSGKENDVDLSKEAPQLDTSIKFDKLQGKEVLFSLEKIVKERVANIDQFYIQEAYYKDIEYDVETEYYIYGIFFGNDYKSTEKDYIIIRQNYETMLYSFEIKQRNITKEEYNQIMINESKKIENLEKIEFNTNNKFELKSINTEDILRRYTDYYTTLALYSTEDAYELLNKEYKEKRFGTLEKYKEYVEGNRNILENYTLKKYALNNEEKNIKYIVVDVYDNYYIIKEKTLLDIEIQLDNYTLEDANFASKYKNLNEEEKVNVCVSKVLKMINTKDYENLYNLLDENYKNNNYKNLEDFKNYLKNNYFNYNELVSTNIKQEVNAYLCTLIISNGNNTSSDEKTNLVLIQLGDNLDFKIAFPK